MTDLPRLTGTDKQIAWATSIRTDALAQVNEFQQRMRTAAANKPGQSHILSAALPAMNAEVDHMVADHTDAAWWIDNRFAIVTQVKAAGSAAAHAVA